MSQTAKCCVNRITVRKEIGSMRGERIGDTNDSSLPDTDREELPIHVLTLPEGVSLGDLSPRDTVTIEYISGRKIDVPASTIFTIDRRSIISGNLPDGVHWMLNGRTIVVAKDGEVISRSDDAGIFGDLPDMEL